MRFSEPAWLVALLGVGMLAAAHRIRHGRRLAIAARFASANRLADLVTADPAWRRHVPLVALLGSVAASVLALAGPALGTQKAGAPVTVVVAIDVSTSMQAKDVQPTRITAAKTAAKQFVDSLEPDVRIALITFAAQATIAVSPTTDHRALDAAIDAAELAPGTAIGEAVFTSLAVLGTHGPHGAGARLRSPHNVGSTAIVVLSDGTTTDGRPEAHALAAARAAGVPVSTIAYGTRTGVIHQWGSTVAVPADAPALRRIADATGGRFFEATTGAELVDALAGVVSTTRGARHPLRLAPWLTAASLALGLLAGAISVCWFARLP